jgi:hypothetical protein
MTAGALTMTNQKLRQVQTAVLVIAVCALVLFAIAD